MAERSSTRQAIEDTARTNKVGKALFFPAKFAGMRNQGATGAPGRMLDVQHLVKQNIFHGELGNAGTIHAAIQQNAIGPGVIATELAPPSSAAPAKVRAFQHAIEISLIQLLE